VEDLEFLFLVRVRLGAKTKVRNVLIKDMLFADDAAIASQHQLGLQILMDSFSESCVLFRLTISQKKTQVMSQATPEPPLITVKGTGSRSSVSVPWLHHIRHAVARYRDQ
jgi:hypothetical protein